MAIEYLKDGVQKAVRHEHASGHQVDDSDAAFHSDGLEHVAAAGRASSDLRSRIRWIARIQHLDWNIFLDCRQQGSGMKHFGAKIGQLGSLIKANDLDAARA